MSRTALFARLVLSATFLVGSAGSAQNQPAGDTTTRRTAPNSDLPLIPTRPLKFTTDEGTWMSLDVSPDGRTIVFDLARRHLHAADRGRLGQAPHERLGVRRAAALLARRQVDRVRQRSRPGARTSGSWIRRASASGR